VYGPVRTVLWADGSLAAPSDPIGVTRQGLAFTVMANMLLVTTVKK